MYDPSILKSFNPSILHHLCPLPLPSQGSISKSYVEKSQNSPVGEVGWHTQGPHVYLMRSSFHWQTPFVEIMFYVDFPESGPFPISNIGSKMALNSAIEFVDHGLLFVHRLRMEQRICWIPAQEISNRRVQVRPNMALNRICENRRLSYFPQDF